MAPETATINTAQQSSGQIIKKLRSFTLYYLQGNLKPLEKVFEIIGTLTDAKLAGMDHCKIMGYKFIRVRPFIVDLKEQEKRKQSLPDWSETDDN